ncbi:hypothetical protein PC120_g12027 [Phytophthora cactorum]|nr:hypothetical protein PC120_g12027 [Phytophthora cactorum]
MLRGAKRRSSKSTTTTAKKAYSLRSGGTNPPKLRKTVEKPAPSVSKLPGSRSSGGNSRLSVVQAAMIQIEPMAPFKAAKPSTDPRDPVSPKIASPAMRGLVATESIPPPPVATHVPTRVSGCT